MNTVTGQRSRSKIEYIDCIKVKMQATKFNVIKRNGQPEEVKFDEITKRISDLSTGLCVDPALLAQKIINAIHHNIRTERIDIVGAEIAESLKLEHPDYSTLAARLFVSNLHKSTPARFSECMEKHYQRTNYMSKESLEFILDHADDLDAMVEHDRDYMFEYNGLQLLKKGYLWFYYRDENGQSQPCTFDRPQYMFMRVAVALGIGYKQRRPDIDRAELLAFIKHRYDLMSTLVFTHATPTLYNSCAASQQAMSCFLVGTDDSLQGILQPFMDCAAISKDAGGIGIHVHNIRSRDSIIKRTMGKASGLVPQLQILNYICRAYNQGGRRNGAIAVYVEPWHADIMSFLQLKLNQGAESERARDLFYALWVPDLFIKRFKNNEKWSLFSADTAPGLSDVYDGMPVCKHCGYCTNKAYAKYILGRTELEIDGLPLEDTGCAPGAVAHEFVQRDVFTELYTRYEAEGRARERIDAAKVMVAINIMQRESGTPFITFKDHVNRCSNQQNIGTIKSSNLCTEIMEWSSDSSYACCCLASISLKQFVRYDSDGQPYYDHAALHDVVKIIAENLDIVIDINAYPLEKCAHNARTYRPIGIGVQGLADTFILMNLPFLSEEATKLDLEIAETIYHAALEKSCEMAQIHGKHVGFDSSPAAAGVLQFDLWKQNQARLGNKLGELHFSGRYDWGALKEKIKKYGLRNSLTTAYMPTVSTARILGNNESFEPISSNIFANNTITGRITVVNKYLVKRLIELGLWNSHMKNLIENNNGSVQNIPGIPDDVKEIYKTVWELKQKELIARAALRGAFIDQAQSLNIHVVNNNAEVLRSVIVYGWEYGIKTGSYYIRTRPAVSPMKINNVELLQVPGSVSTNRTSPPTGDEVCPIGCTSCSS